MNRLQLITERCPPPESDRDSGRSAERPVVALAERVEYLLTIASSFGTEPEFTRQEEQRLLRLCRILELPAHETELVLDAAQRACAARRRAEPRFASGTVTLVPPSDQPPSTLRR